jgi:hypothetical protein
MHYVPHILHHALVTLMQVSSDLKVIYATPVASHKLTKCLYKTGSIIFPEAFVTKVLAPIVVRIESFYGDRKLGLHMK